MGLWVPFVSVAITLLVPLFIYFKFGNSESFRAVLGIVVGIILGFGMDLGKQSIETNIRKEDLRSASIKLLKTDGTQAYSCLMSMHYIHSQKDFPKNKLPAKIELPTWKILRTDKEFLLQGAEKPFDEIFLEYENIDYINEIINSRLTNHWNPEHLRMFLWSLYEQEWQSGRPKRVVRNWMSESEIDSLENDYKKLLDK